MSPSAQDIGASVVLIVTFVFAYRDVVLSDSVFAGVNMAVPGQIQDYLVGLVPGWYPGLLGFPSQPNLLATLYMLFSLSSSPAVVERLLLLSLPLAGVAMYLTLSKTLEISRVGRLVSGLAFSLAFTTTDDFTDTTNWGYAVLPVFVYYAIHTFSGNRKSDLVRLVLSSAFVVEFAPQLLPFMAISLVVFALLFRGGKIGRLSGLFGNMLKLFLGGAMFLSLSFLTVRGLQSYLNPNPYLTRIASPLGPGYEPYALYSHETILNVLRFIPGNSWLTNFQLASPLGIVLAIFAFSALLSPDRPFVRKAKLALVIITIAVFAWASLARQSSPLFLSLTGAIPFLEVLIYPERPFMLVALAYSAFLGKFTDMAGSKIHRLVRAPNHLRQLRWIPHLLVALLVLGTTFAYFPTFNVENHAKMYYEFSDSYHEIRQWLSKDGQSFRYMVVPFGGNELVPGDPRQFAGGGLSYGTSDSDQFARYAIRLMEGQSVSYYGRILGLANVKYVVVNFQPSEVGEYADLGTQTLARGPIRTGDGSYAAGSPANYLNFMKAQRDFVLVEMNSQFAVFLNTSFVPALALRNSITLVSGGLGILDLIGTVPALSVNQTTLVPVERSLSVLPQLLGLTSSVVMFNSVSSESVTSAHGAEGTLTFVQSDSFAALTPSRNFTMFAIVEPTHEVTQDDTIVDISSAIAFVLTRQNFRESRDPPRYDFDNAGYLFYFGSGGQYDFTFVGSGEVWAYIAHDSSLSHVGDQVVLFGPTVFNNQTIELSLPANTVLQILVNGYNPAMGQMVPDNLERIEISPQEAPVLTIDSESYSPILIKEDTGTIMFPELSLQAGMHELIFEAPYREKWLILTTTNDLRNVFGNDGNGVTPRDFKKVSPGSYKVTLQSPAIVVLGESYHANWVMTPQPAPAVHFEANFFANGFLAPKGEVSVDYHLALADYIPLFQSFAWVTLSSVLLLELVLTRSRNVKRWKQPLLGERIHDFETLR